jgi:hypothetical protein
MGVSPLTGKKRSVSTISGILAHIHTNKHQISPSDFKILSTASSEADLLIRESLFISKLNPTLNANIRSTPLELFKFFARFLITNHYIFNLLILILLMTGCLSSFLLFAYLNIVTV